MRRHWLLWFSLLASFAGNTAQAADGVNVVFFGGFGSCPIDGDPAELHSGNQLDAFVDQVEAQYGRGTADFRACFAIGSSRLFVRLPDQEIFETSPEDAIAMFAADLAASPNPTILIGQSHGGTMAARLAAAMAPHHIVLLVTIDPISMENCGPGSFTGSYLDWIFFGGGGNGCTGLPAEIKRTAPLLLAHTDHWFNLYQEDFGALHSGPAPMADIDWRLEGLDDSAVMRQHAATAYDANMWSMITAEALAH